MSYEPDQFGNEDDEQWIGWVSMADIFMLSTVVLIGLTAVTVFHGRGLNEKYQASEVAVAKLDSLRRSLEQDLIDSREELAAIKLQLALIRGNLSKRERELKENEKQSDKSREMEGRLRMDLIGLRGDLNNVVFVIDRSASMARDDRWENTQKTVATWLELLPVGNAAVIVFNDRLELIPQGTPRYLAMDSAESREALIEELRELKPERGTDTLAALRQAFEYPNVDTIVLFTDGNPDVLDRDPEDLKSEVLEFLKERKERGIFINVVGLGAYYDQPELVKFLMEIAEITKGSYRAR